jgi:hypothetical protein
MRSHGRSESPGRRRGVASSLHSIRRARRSKWKKPAERVRPRAKAKVRHEGRHHRR